VLRRCAFRRSGRGQRFDAFAALGRQQSDTVVLERSDPVGMAQNQGQIGCVSPEAFLRAAPIVKIHPIPLEGSNLHCYQTTIASGQAEFLNDLGILLSRIRARPGTSDSGSGRLGSWILDRGGER
jgi:hypothetical protein